MELKLAIFSHVCDVLVTYKRHNPLCISLFSLQIDSDLREVKNPREKGGNPPICGKKMQLDVDIEPTFRFAHMTCI